MNVLAGKHDLLAEFLQTELDVWGHSREGQKKFYSQINTTDNGTI